MRLNVIQDVATPHNNVVLTALKQDPSIELVLWYCSGKTAEYSGNEELTNAVIPSRYYHAATIDWTLIWYALSHPKEKFLLVGWMNPSTKLLFVLWSLLRRPFNMWFDYPQDDSLRSPLKAVLRQTFYRLLKFANCRIFCVGKMTVDYFRLRGFAENRLVNLPIFVDISKRKADYASFKDAIWKKYQLKNDDFLITAGSRLISDKGFDLLIEAFHRLPADIRRPSRCIIVGKGPEKIALERLIERYRLTDQIRIVDWMDIEDLKALVANSDIFVHCARFDAYGGGTLNAMVVGTPVIGSLNAGSAPDRIEHGRNGYLYKAEDTAALADLLQSALQDRKKLANMGTCARQTAEKWPPSLSAQIIQGSII
jgi:glycosyltransferase involved in cell wall biosynthesis